MCGGFLVLFWIVCTNLNGNIKMYFDFKHTFCPSSLPSRQRPLCDRRLLWAGGTTTEAPVRRHDHVKNDTFHCARKSIRQKAAEPDFSETYLVGILSEKKPNQAPSQVPSALVQEAEKKQYFPARYNMEQMHNTILLLVRNWSKKRGYTK